VSTNDAGQTEDVPPLVSVVTATYNRSNVLRYAIQSVLWQTRQDFEMLIIGDACTDDSEQVVASFNDPRLRWHNLPENSGSQSKPNMVGIGMARGKYIAYLGHDDLWLPHHLAALVQTMEDTGADMVFSLALLVGPDGPRTVLGFTPSDKFEPEMYLGPSAVIHHRTLTDEIGPWKDHRTLVEPIDIEFFARAYAQGKRIDRLTDLTVVKFPSPWFKKSYQRKPWEEQANYARRIQTEPDFRYRELLGVAEKLSLGRYTHKIKPNIPLGAPPGGVADALRVVRGLTPHSDASLKRSIYNWTLPQRLPERFKHLVRRFANLLLHLFRT
jgi:glycosyltransferase involved in cell wall biosynthesis